MVVQYKCPNCGSDLTYDNATGKLKCQSCQHLVSLEDVPKYHADVEENDEVFRAEDIPDEKTYDYTYESPIEHKEFTSSDIHEYHCENCGATIITNADTTATSCSYCGAPVVLSDRLSGHLAPSKIIPFKISREEAQQKFRHWCKNGRFVPDEFKNADRVKNITGMYVPFWLYDLNGSGDADAICTRIRHYTRGDYDYTETSYFHVYRKFNLNYLKIPVDASEKMDDTLMDRLEPFTYHDLNKFEMPYLAGYQAEKYNYDGKACYSRAESRTRQYVETFLAGTMAGYATTRYNRKNINISEHNCFYTLLPVWMVYYDFHDTEHIFAMNGQTGKIVGKPPISKKKVAIWYSVISLILFAIIKVLVLIAGGPLL